MSLEIQVPIISLPAELEGAEVAEMINLSTMCRLCGNQNNRLIGLYSEDSISNDIPGKINLYLPIKVTENDHFPLNCCWQCLSTLLVWHELFVKSVETDQKLRSFQFISEKQFEDMSNAFEGTNQILTVSAEETLVATASISKDAIKLEPIDRGPTFLVETHIPQLEENSLPLHEETSRDIEELNTDQGLQEVSTLHLDEIVPLYVQEQDLSPGWVLCDCRKQCEQFKNKSDNSDLLEACNESNIILAAPKLEDKISDKHYNIPDTDVNLKSLTNSKKYECIYCAAEFTSQSAILEHMKTAGHATQRTKNSTGSKKGYKMRAKWYNIKDMVKYPLPKVKREEVYKARIVVNGKTFYKCKECAKELHSIYTYVWHTRIHTGERPFVCSICNKDFRVSQGLLRHIKETHEKVKDYHCDTCGADFTTKRNLDEHRRIHSNERPYICKTCGKSFKQKASLFVHNRSHTTEFPFSCSGCDQKFRTRASLLVHSTKHTGEKPHPCEICGRQFRIKYELKRHRLIHKDDKPFTCRVCKQTFRQKRYLRNHYKLNHQMEEPQLSEMLLEYKKAIYT
ncbi:zinc finger protein 586-like [Anthonomus grandis grandis]|uniref:zinc finger protein 586-like n=1 Tax=Anthonomus grandis grandis TaxID=2921223 RepID=UPI0021669A13|nr:zinc finger protein 586-like [Anthonomus grandis grandis]